jgi:iron complex transport system permease protein
MGSPVPGDKQIKTLKNRTIIISLLLLFFLMFMLDLFLGSVKIPISDIFHTLFTGKSSKNEYSFIILDFRLPKAAAAILAGIALSVSGLLMQTLFRNPLAGPDILGVTSGASLGVALLVLTSTPFIQSLNQTVAGNWAIIVAACVGAISSLLLVMFVSSRVKDIMVILILGIMIGAAISSVVSILQYFGNENVLKSFVIWTFGSLGHISKVQLLVFAPCIVVGLILAILSVKKLDALLLGEKYATTMGLNIKSTRILIFLSTGILAGSAAAFCGPIAFIGIAVPHISRLLFKTDQHRIILVSTIITGAIVMLFCDIVSQLPGSNMTIPLNSVTALIGIPIIIWIIAHNYKRNLKA